MPTQPLSLHLRYRMTRLPGMRTTSGYRVRVRSIQYNRTTSFARSPHWRPVVLFMGQAFIRPPHSASPFTALAAACTRRNRKKLLPCLGWLPADAAARWNPRCKSPHVSCHSARAETARPRPASTPWPSPPPDPLPDASSATALPAAAPLPLSPLDPVPRSVLQIRQQVQQIVSPPRRPAIQSSPRNSSCPARVHSFRFFCIPWFSAMCCNWFFTRVRICTSVCRCFNNCRRSRSSTLGPQMRGKLFSRSSCSRWRASRTSVFCLRGAFARITPASPSHSSCPSFCSSRSNHNMSPLLSTPTRTGPLKDS